MIQRQLKLKLTKLQTQKLDTWLNQLTGVWNFAIRKIELDAKDNIYYSPKKFQNILAKHSEKLGIPSHILQGILSKAYTAWDRCFRRISKKPRMKGLRNKLNYIPLPDPIRHSESSKLRIPGLGLVRFHKQILPNAKIKNGCIVKRASGWYLCLFIDTEPNKVPVTASGQIGIDPGFKTLLILSTGEKIDHPKELQRGGLRLAQAQRGKDKKLTARLHERMQNQRKDRNHKLSRRLVSENELICFSKDNLKSLSKKFGKSVSAASVGQLRQMITYKSNQCGRRYVEVASRFSTMTCSTCGAKSGPTGLHKLAVRHWRCACGAQHDRDHNAAMNTLIAGAGTALELSRIST
jgi:putative transposase